MIGWTDPEGSRPWLGALLLGYYDPDGRLIYAGRVGYVELGRLWRRLQPLSTPDMRAYLTRTLLMATASIVLGGFLAVPTMAVALPQM